MGNFFYISNNHLSSRNTSDSQNSLSSSSLNELEQTVSSSTSSRSINRLPLNRKGKRSIKNNSSKDIFLPSSPSSKVRHMHNQYQNRSKKSDAGPGGGAMSLESSKSQNRSKLSDSSRNTSKTGPSTVSFAGGASIAVKNAKKSVRRAAGRLLNLEKSNKQNCAGEDKCKSSTANTRSLPPCSKIPVLESPAEKRHRAGSPDSSSKLASNESDHQLFASPVLSPGLSSVDCNNQEQINRKECHLLSSTKKNVRGDTDLTKSTASCPKINSMITKKDHVFPKNDIAMKEDEERSDKTKLSRSEKENQSLNIQKHSEQNSQEISNFPLSFSNLWLPLTSTLRRPFLFGENDRSISSGDSTCTKSDSNLTTIIPNQSQFHDFEFQVRNSKHGIIADSNGVSNGDTFDQSFPPPPPPLISTVREDPYIMQHHSVNLRNIQLQQHTLWLKQNLMKQNLIKHHHHQQQLLQQNQFYEQHLSMMVPNPSQVINNSEGSNPRAGGVETCPMDSNTVSSLALAIRNQERSYNETSINKHDNNNTVTSLLRNASLTATKSINMPRSDGGNNEDDRALLQDIYSRTSHAKPHLIPSLPKEKISNVKDLSNQMKEQKQKQQKSLNIKPRRGRRPSYTAKGKEPRPKPQRNKASNKKQRAAQQASSPISNKSLLRNDDYSKSNRRSRELSPPPLVRIINGKKVTIVDDERKVFVIDLLSPETCDLIRTMTDDHVRKVNESGSGTATWRTLYTYTKQDLPCSEVKGLSSRVTDGIMKDIIKIIGEIYGDKKEAAKLRPRSWKEPHLLLYQKVQGKPDHTGVEMHYDGCHITWNAMLSKSSEYEGGGTYYRILRKTIRLEQGQILVSPGELYHLGVDITSGVRSLIICFMDGFDPKIVDDSSQQEDKEIYQKNVRMY